MEALTSGAVNADQAAVIAEAIQELPEELESASVDKAEAILVDWAAELELRQLRKHAARILGHVAPESLGGGTLDTDDPVTPEQARRNIYHMRT